MGLIISDTNAVLYILKGLHQMQPYLHYEFAISDVTVIELLGVKDIPKNSIEARELFINSSYNFPINIPIRDLAIKLKQKYTLKVADALIAATAIHHSTELLTADNDFKKIKELSLILVAL